jgi:hypothetical protein
MGGKMKPKSILCCLLLGLALAACTLAFPSQPVSPDKPDGWDVQVIQDGRVIPAVENDFSLARHPFVLQVIFTRGDIPEMNVLDDDSNYALDPSQYCQGEVYVFCEGTGSAEGSDRNYNTYLAIDALGSNYWPEYAEERWSSLYIVDDTVIGTRYVDQLMFPERGDPFLMLPVEEFSGQRLYAVMYMEMNGNGAIDAGEIWKFTLTFSGQ